MISLSHYYAVFTVYIILINVIVSPLVLSYEYSRKPILRRIGSVLPQPKDIHFPNGLDFLHIERPNFAINLTVQVESCSTVKKAAERYLNRYIFEDVRPMLRDLSDSELGKPIGSLMSLTMKASEDRKFLCDPLPHENMNEAYSLSVTRQSRNTSAAGYQAILIAPTNWGLIRGLETFSQLVFNVEQPNSFAIRPVRVDDEPRFKYRGYMLDTARHYISLNKIFNSLDAMSFNKLNVFHWHIVDDQSFPFESKSFPQLSKQNALRPELIYSHEDVRAVVKYAADRGIRVIPELDSPGHTYALRSIDNYLTKCYNTTTLVPNGDLGPTDPTSLTAYTTIIKLVREYQSLFPETYFHAGGDEVQFECWKSNPNINSWMDSHNMSSNYMELNNYYLRRMYDILSHHNKTMLVWQEVYDLGATLPKDTIVQVWKYINDKPAYMAELKNVISSGYKAILSSCWYLNYIDYGQDWVKFYTCDPTGEPILERESKFVLGGEICMWTEFVDDTNVLTRTWPRASAAAERLWSPKSATDPNEFLYRLEQMRCRLLARNIQAEPINGPGYC